ncbi:hypothetical protein HC776_02475, partial [bacterium]|nr:hypothetical protein [bacterium]
VSRSHALIVLSSLPEKSRLPSDDNARLETPPVCVPSMNEDSVEDACGVFVGGSAANDDNAGTKEAPLATIGAAIARPDVKTICLAGDGAGMYTVQSLWTMARENLDILTIVFVNNAYRILRIELARTGAGNPGPAANGMLSLGSPDINWVKLAEGMGVEAAKATTLEGCGDLMRQSFSREGPFGDRAGNLDSLPCEAGEGLGVGGSIPCRQGGRGRGWGLMTPMLALSPARAIR